MPLISLFESMCDQYYIDKWKETLPLISQCDRCLLENEIDASSQMKLSLYISVIFSSSYMKSKLTHNWNRWSHSSHYQLRYSLFKRVIATPLFTKGCLLGFQVIQFCDIIFFYLKFLIILWFKDINKSFLVMVLFISFSPTLSLLSIIYTM